ncbi:hypothetical protein ACJX0J_025222, partial [Zea mays]
VLTALIYPIGRVVLLSLKEILKGHAKSIYGKESLDVLNSNMMGQGSLLNIQQLNNFTWPNPAGAGAVHTMENEKSTNLNKLLGGALLTHLILHLTHLIDIF